MSSKELGTLENLEHTARTVRALLPRNMEFVLIAFESDFSDGYVLSAHSSEYTIARLEDALRRLKQGPPDLPAGTTLRRLRLVK